MLIQALALFGKNRMLTFSLQPRVLRASSDIGTEFYSIDAEGHVEQVPEMQNLRYHGVDTSTIGQRHGLFFVLTPTAADEIPPQKQMMALKQGTSLRINLCAVDFEIFAVLPNPTGSLNFIAFVDGDRAKELLQSDS